MTSLILQRPGFTLDDIFAGFEEAQKENAAVVNKREVFQSSGGLKKVRFYRRYKNTFFNHLTGFVFVDIANYRILKRMKTAYNNLLIYNSSIIQYVDTLAEFEKMELYAEYNFNYTEKLEDAKIAIKHFREAHRNRQTLLKISDVQLDFVDAIIKTDGELFNKVYTDSPDITTKEYIAALKQTYEGFEIED